MTQAPSAFQQEGLSDRPDLPTTHGCVMPKNELEGLPVVDAGEDIKVAVSLDDLQAGDAKDPQQHPIAIALRRSRGIDDARVTNSETLIRRGKRWFRYGAIEDKLFKELRKTLTGE